MNRNTMCNFQKSEGTKENKKKILKRKWRQKVTKWSTQNMMVHNKSKHMNTCMSHK